MVQVWRMIVLMRLGCVRMLVRMPRSRCPVLVGMLMVAVIVTMPMRVHRRDVCVRVPVLLGTHQP